MIDILLALVIFGSLLTPIVLGVWYLRATDRNDVERRDSERRDSSSWSPVDPLQSEVVDLLEDLQKGRRKR